jgi:hypothetical protein
MDKKVQIETGPKTKKDIPLEIEFLGRSFFISF